MKYVIRAAPILVALALFVSFLAVRQDQPAEAAVAVLSVSGDTGIADGEGGWRPSLVVVESDTSQDAWHSVALSHSFSEDPLNTPYIITFVVEETASAMTLRGRLAPAFPGWYEIDSGGAHHPGSVDDNPSLLDDVIFGEFTNDGRTTGSPVLFGFSLATVAIAATSRRRRRSGHQNTDFGASADQGDTEDPGEGFGDILRRYRSLLGVTKTKLSALLGRGFSIGELSLLERGLKPPPKSERKLNHLAATLADAIAAGHKMGPGEATVLKDRILRELSVASAAYRPIDDRSAELAMRWIADLMTGDQSNAGYARDAIRASRSISEAYDVMYCLLPEARERGKQLDLVRRKSRRRMSDRGKGSTYENGQNTSR